MTHHADELRSTPTPRAPFSRSGSGSVRLIFFLLVAMGLLATALSAADPVYKACGKKWARQAAKLSQQQLAWLMDRRTAELSGDLDGDFLPDKVSLDNHGSFRNCDVAATWGDRETTVTIELGNGRKKIVHWIGAQQAQRMVYYHGTGRLLVIGLDAAGRTSNKWVVFGDGSTPPSVELALDERGDEPAAMLAAVER